jgi:hypothetical protein
MLRSIRDLETFRIGASDGTIGSVKDFYFDDQAWVIRYAVVATGIWFGGREVLISPMSIGTADWDAQVLPVSITKEQVRHCPAVDTHKPVSRQHEAAYLGYYGYPYYWQGSGLWGEAEYPGAMLNGGAFRSAVTVEKAGAPDDDDHLRSCNAVKGYHIHATDGDLGHVQGYLLDEETWAIRYLIVNTSNWWLGHPVLIAPDWIEEVSWEHANVTTTLNRQRIKAAPPFDAGGTMSRSDEAAVYQHYGHRGYWVAGD